MGDINMTMISGPSLCRINMRSVPAPVMLMALFCFVLSSCIPEKREAGKVTLFEVNGFNPIANSDSVSCISNDSNTLICLDYTDAMQGFVIPSPNQSAYGMFHFEFLIKNTSGTPQKFRYKIFYQNESYKYPETNAHDREVRNLKASDNFYGSWEKTGTTFIETPLIPVDNDFHKVSGSFRIVGNPRNEERYFYGTVNERWKRNPRTGDYSFMLVVTNEKSFKTIPQPVQDISLKEEGAFVNPYWYFLFGGGKETPELRAIIASKILKVIAKPDLRLGVYTDPTEFATHTVYNYPNSVCGPDSVLERDAPLKQFIHHVDAASAWDNIPVQEDVLNAYSLADYNWWRAFCTREEMLRIKPSVADCPCADVRTDSSGTISIRNPSAGSDWKKQNVGVITRHGFTYGKFTVKADLTELLNNDNIWNGITNAIWLITQSNDEWNNRCECEGKGYLPKYYGGSDEERSLRTAYSEIDFEILKTVPYCPQWSFPPAYYYPVANRYDINSWNIPLPEEVNNGNITISCTNWDMACPEPPGYNVGCFTVPYGDSVYLAHRWDYWYRAITEKYEAPDDELFGSDYYYFQIEWKPTEIIWRIGPEKDMLRTVAYMNDQVTSIPNNQMLLIISQEFHNTTWWHGSPFKQGYVPFPKNPIVGKIFEIIIE